MVLLGQGGAQNYSDDDDDDQPSSSGMQHSGMVPPMPPGPPMGMGMHGMPHMGMMHPPGTVTVLHHELAFVASFVLFVSIKNVPHYLSAI